MSKLDRLLSRIINEEINAQPLKAKKDSRANAKLIGQIVTQKGTGESLKWLTFIVEKVVPLECGMG